jgi:hypothetical protein
MRSFLVSISFIGACIVENKSGGNLEKACKQCGNRKIPLIKI